MDRKVIGHILVVDDQGNWRDALTDLLATEGHTVNQYEVPTVILVLTAHYDLQNGRYLARNIFGEGTKIALNEPLDPKDFTTAALRRMGRY